MPSRSKVVNLPEDIRAALDQRLVASNFQNYGKLADWLNEKGFDISRSSVHRHGQEFGEKLAAIKIATEQAQAISKAVGDDPGVLGDALTRLCQEKAFQVLVKMEDIDPDAVDLNKLGIMISRLNRTAVAQKKWIAEYRSKADKAIENIKEKTASLGQKKSLDPETLKIIKEQIYGIF